MSDTGPADEKATVSDETPKLIRVLCLLISLVAGVIALLGVFMLPMSDSDHRWFGVGFEAVALVACLFGIAVGIGRLRNAPALTMLTVGGILFVAAMLSERALGARLAGENLPPMEIRGFVVLPIALAQVGLGVLMGGLSALTVLSRNPSKSLPYLFRGLAFGVPVVAILGLFVVPGIRSQVMGLSKPILTVTLILGGIFLGALVSVSGHLLIRAFEVGQIEEGSTTAR